MDVESHVFQLPKKEILQADRMKQWENSSAYADLVGFILTMNDAVKNKKIQDHYEVSVNVSGVHQVVIDIAKWIDEIPPIEQPQRFGNKAFRDFFKRLQDSAGPLLERYLDSRFHCAIPEIAVYLVDSFGNSTRIDYGTGHELAFVAFLCCLFKIGYFRDSDAVAVVLRIFNSYLDTVRKLQQTYNMEPAGSHGVWSLDDYQFLPFLWGSSQLLDHPKLLPKSITNADVAEAYHQDFLFLGCIRYINKVKRGPFAEHSNQLWNISGVPSWSKVNQGLIKMYKAEVLAKFPIVQHIFFGSLLSLSPASGTAGN